MGYWTEREAELPEDAKDDLWREMLRNQITLSDPDKANSLKSKGQFEAYLTVMTSTARDLETSLIESGMEEMEAEREALTSLLPLSPEDLATMTEEQMEAEALPDMEDAAESVLASPQPKTPQI